MPRARILGLILFAATLLPAQMHHVDQPQQVTRAIGVYEWTGDLNKPDSSRLIPVSIFIHGQFEDAGVYLAQPVPLALETGNVYSIQRSGDPIGTVDLDFARDVVDRRDVSDDNPLGAWYGYGRFLPLSAMAVTPLHASSHPAAIVSSLNDDSQPRFINRTPGEAGNPPTGSSPSSTTSTPAPPDDPDRPVLHRAPNSGSTDSGSATDNAPDSPGTPSIDDDPDRPTLGHRDDSDNERQKRHKHDKDGGAVIPLSTSLNDDPDRPMLHRGKVASAMAPPQLTGLPASLHQAVAVSDAANRPIHVFARSWDSLAEKTDMLAALEKLAQPLARQYMTANRLQPAAAASGPKLVSPKLVSPKLVSKTRSSTSRARTAAHRKSSTRPAPPLAFQDEQLNGFTLSYGGLPTFVYSAAVPTVTGPTTSGPLVRVTVVVQRLPSGNLQTSLTSVTDDNHLDRTPWMRLIDAVDPDASHRASLLFELRAKGSRQFALYSLAYAQAQQTFVTGLIE